MSSVARLVGGKTTRNLWQSFGSGAQLDVPTFYPSSTVHSWGPVPEFRVALLMVSWSKFKAAPALKGPDGVWCILPTGSIIFVPWTATVSTAPHPAALPGSELALATFGITHPFSYFHLFLIGRFFIRGKWCMSFFLKIIITIIRSIKIITLIYIFLYCNILNQPGARPCSTLMILLAYLFI